MKAAVFYGGHDIRVEKLPDPEPGPGEVLLRVRSAGVCGSDLHPYRAPPVDGIREPHQRGHELAADVVALGEGVEDVSAGQRVGVEAEHLLGCGACRACRHGQNHICADRGFRNGERQESHGFSQLDVCLATSCHVLPESVSFDAATQLDCYACGVHALNRMPVGPDSTVVVIGTGAIGMTLGQLARAYGAGQVVMVGTRPEPLAIAMEANAADVVLAISDGDPVQALLDSTNGHGADTVFETVGGKSSTIDQAIGMARYGGSVSVLGVFTGSPTVDVRSAYRKELNIRWSNSYSSWQGVSEYQTALRLLVSGWVDPSAFITSHFPLESIGEAFAAADDKRNSGAIKVMVHP